MGTIMRPGTLAIAGLFAFLSSAASAQEAPGDEGAAESTSVVDSEQAQFVEVTIAEGLGFPWSLAFLPDGRMLLTEKDGRLRLIENDVLAPEPIAGVPEIYRQSDSGLHEVLPHPRFAENGLLYLSFTQGTEEANRLVVMRARLEGHALVEAQEIFRVSDDKLGPSHPGARMVFLDEETLLITVGDGYDLMDEAQELYSHFGTVVRINDDGSIPADNPFRDTDGALPEIWTYGHRNAQGLAIEPATGDVWLHEHGPRGGDEINILRAGTNYGWPAITYGIDYDGTTISEHRAADGMAQPVWYWVPSIAPSGMAFYTGDAFPDWEGDLFVGALAGLSMERLEIEDGHVIGVERLLAENEERIRDVRTGPDGFLYILTDADPGRLFRLEPR